MSEPHWPNGEPAAPPEQGEWVIDEHGFVIGWNSPVYTINREEWDERFGGDQQVWLP